MFTNPPYSSQTYKCDVQRVPTNIAAFSCDANVSTPARERSRIMMHIHVLCIRVCLMYTTISGEFNVAAGACQSIEMGWAFDRVRAVNARACNAEEARAQAGALCVPFSPFRCIVDDVTLRRRLSSSVPASFIQRNTRCMWPPLSFYVKLITPLEKTARASASSCITHHQTHTHKQTNAHTRRRWFSIIWTVPLGPGA